MFKKFPLIYFLALRKEIKLSWNWENETVVSVNKTRMGWSESNDNIA